MSDFKFLKNNQLIDADEEIQSRYNNILKNIGSSNGKIVYRGMRVRHICERYRLNNYLSFEQLIANFADCLFVIGYKSSNYTKMRKNNIHNVGGDVQGEYDWKIDEGYWQRLLKNSYLKFRFSDNVVREFIDNASIEEQKAIAKYYEIYLHQKGNTSELNEYPYESMFCSTSDDFEQARGYLGKDRSGVVVYYMLTEEDINQQFDLSETIKVLEKYELPKITVPYPEEREFSVKKALFPQKILGFDVYEKNVLKYQVLNQYLAGNNFNLECVLKEGLIIDQSDFYEKAQETAFDRIAIDN